MSIENNVPDFDQVPVHASENDSLNPDQIAGENGEMDAQQFGGQLGAGETDGPQKINDLGTEKFAGGFAFGDWDTKSDLLYDIAGVTHRYNLLGNDVYEYRGRVITYKQAKELKRITQYMMEAYPQAKTWELGEKVGEEWNRRYPDPN